MNKRQRKKNQKKYILIVADEWNLINMTEEERKTAWKDYYEFRERYAFRKRYGDLKEAKPLRYYFPSAKADKELIDTLTVFRSNKPAQSITVTQCLDDIIKHYG